MIEYAIVNGKNLYFEITEHHGNFVFVSEDPTRAYKVKDKASAKKLITRIKNHNTTRSEVCRVAKITTTVEILN